MFLDDDEDLISLQHPLTTQHVLSTSPSPGLVPVCILTMTLLPLLFFKVMTGVLNRLILLTILLATGLGSLEKLDVSRAEQHRQLVMACFGVSLLAAMLF